MSEEVKSLKIYIASSWKNSDLVRSIAKFLRNIGNEVDDFTDESMGRYVFHYSEIGNLQDLDPITFMYDPRAQRAFEQDKKMIDWADVIIMLMPAGKSSHLEAGYAKGSGKKMIVYWPETVPKGEFDVMYGFADLLTDNPIELLDFLDKERKKDESVIPHGTQGTHQPDPQGARK